MARYLFTWELGAGMGHLASIRPVAKLLADKGHKVFVALRDLAGASKILQNTTVLPAPTRVISRSQLISRPGTFADLLYNAGFGSAASLSGLAEGWRNLFDLVRPDCVIMDFSPATLVALQGYPTRKIQMGTGYYCPPDISPLPDICPALKNYPERMKRTERTVLEHINQQLSTQGQPKIERIGSLFKRVDHSILLTFSELDHYGPRTDFEYFGCWSSVKGDRPFWPEGGSKKIFAYLRPFRALPKLLEHLSRIDASTLIYIAGEGREKFKKFSNSKLSVVENPVDINLTGKHCDIAILYASHGTACQLLLAGKPILALPMHAEQHLVGERIVDMGAGINVPTGDPKDIGSALEELIDNTRYADAAQSFAKSYSQFDVNTQLEKAIDLIDTQT